jgi:oligoendopeptidase F
VKENNVLAENIQWDLCCLYQAADDPQIDADVLQWTLAAKAFHAEHAGKLQRTLPQAIRDNIALYILGDKPVKYLSMRQALDSGDAAINAKLAWLHRETSPIEAEYLEFFRHELVRMDDAVIQTHAAKDPIVRKHMPWIDKIRSSKPHLLPELVESALKKRDPFSSTAWSEFFEEVEADLRFPWDSGEKTLTEVLHILNEDPDAEARAAALETMNRGFSGYYAKYSAQTLFIVAGAAEVEIRDRVYANPMERRNKSNRLPNTVVETLHTTVTQKAGPLARRYYKLKAAILGVPTLAWSDRNAPMPFADSASIPWDDALETALTAYRSFSPWLAGLIEEMVAKKCIDARVAPGKHSGAFNESFVLSDGPVSFTLLNYLGTDSDVMTLAHELGHGVHGLLSGHAQGPLMQQAPAALAETASIFGEMTTFMYLKEQLAETGEREQMLALIMRQLDGMINTVVRQIGFSNFERRLHGWDPATEKWKGTRKFSVAELDTLWLETVYELYGKPGEVFTFQHVEHLWAYISHFHMPFYVYGYAVGELITQSLYAARPRLGASFEPLYVHMLEMSSTVDAVELLALFDLNLNDPAFWADSIRVSMEAMLNEAEQLARDMGLLT